MKLAVREQIDSKMIHTSSTIKGGPLDREKNPNNENKFIAV